MAGLAAFVEDGVFTPDGVDRAVNVLKSHMKRVRYFGCKRVDVFATAVLRNAANCAKAVAEIERRCGLAVTLLSARDEAHLGFVGARCSTPLERGTLVDIGGGSTELTRVEGGRDSDDVSLGQGSLSSFARFVRNILPAPIEMNAASLSSAATCAKLPSLEPYKAPRSTAWAGPRARRPNWSSSSTSCKPARARSKPSRCSRSCAPAARAPRRSGTRPLRRPPNACTPWCRAASS